MRIGLISTRIAGTDGVTLEVEKWTRVLQILGHQTFFCAGELGEYAVQGTYIPRLHFHHPEIHQINHQAFHAPEANPVKLLEEIEAIAADLQSQLTQFVTSHRLDLVIIQNALAIPMNLPLGLALFLMLEQTGLPALAHHHDFYWERQRFQASCLPDFLDRIFPPALPSIQHLTINSIAQARLKARRGLESLVIPNVHDFANPPPPVDAYNRDLRRVLGLSQRDYFILQPTRVIPRKGIELAIELVSRMNLPGTRLRISHSAGDEGLHYWNWLQHEARLMGVDLQKIDHLVGSQRKQMDGHKIYSLWDVYPHANLVTYPSLYEGFGNALLETVYYKRLVVINRYPVYNADIRPLGFQFIELEGYIHQQAVDQAVQGLQDPQSLNQTKEINYQIAREHFSLEFLESRLKTILGSSRPTASKQSGTNWGNGGEQVGG